MEWKSNYIPPKIMGLITYPCPDFVARYFNATVHPKYTRFGFCAIFQLWQDIPGSKVHGANAGSTWVLSAPYGPHVGPMNLAIRNINKTQCCFTSPVPVKQHWRTHRNKLETHVLTTTKQSTTQPCAYRMGYTVYPCLPISQTVSLPFPLPPSPSASWSSNL